MENNEEEKKVNIHEESGLRYYEVKLNATQEEGKSISLRLFESIKPGRLKWENDEETHDEYKVRMFYMQKKTPDQLIWKSSWGPLTDANALRVQAAISEGKEPTPWAYMEHGDKYDAKDRLAVERLRRLEEKKKLKKKSKTK
jgi:hypothetical protein